MTHPFKPYDLDQPFLLPPDIRDWLPQNHLARFVDEAIGELDLSPILRPYRNARGGRPAYDPRMMVRLLIYAYCMGMTSSRRIETATWEDVPTRVLAGNLHPDHDTIADFRKRHLRALADLFEQVLKLCQKAGLVKVGHVALDGTKVRANASKAKSSTYERICKDESELTSEVKRLLDEAARTDDAEDREFGKGKRGDELPDELSRVQSRRAKLREAKKQLEIEARDRAEKEAAEQERKRTEQEARVAAGGRQGRPVVVPDPTKALPEPTAQYNFTDPDSEIMKEGATRAFTQSYNAQLVVDTHAQIIVARTVVNQASDRPGVVALLQQVEQLTGLKPAQASADAGCFSEDNVTSPELKGTELYIPPEALEKRYWAKPRAAGARTAQGPGAVAMRAKLATPEGKKTYGLRKETVEPVFGQIKHIRGFRMFSLRGLVNVNAEWDLVCLTHNLLKLYRNWKALRPAPGGVAAPTGRETSLPNSSGVALLVDWLLTVLDRPLSLTPAV
jgi:transposase